MSDKAESRTDGLPAEPGKQDGQPAELRQALAELGSAFVEVYDSAPVGYVILDPDSRILEANLTAADLLGCTCAELQNKCALADFIHPDSLDTWASHRRYLREHQEKHGNDLVLQRADGSVFTARVECTPCLNANGEIERCLTVLVDITQRAQAEGLMAEALAGWQATYDAMADAVFILDVDQRVLRANKAAASYFGIPVEKMKGRRCWEIVHASAAPVAECPVRRMLKSLRRESMELSVGGSHYQVTVDPLKNEKGELCGIVHIVRDITASKQTEQELARLNLELEQRVEERSAELRESEERFRVLFEENPDACFLVDLDGRFVDGNKAVERLIGYSREELVGQSISASEIFPPLAKRLAYERIERKRAGEKLVPAEYVLRHKGGIEVVVEVTSIPISLQGETVLLVNAHDLTHRKRAEQDLHESEEKYRQLFEAESDAIMIFDGETRRFVDVNNAALELYGYSREEFLQLTHQSITADPELAKSRIPATLAGLRFPIFLSRHRKKDGTVFPVEISASSFSVKGRPVLCGVVRDISTRIAREEELNRHRRELRNLASELSLAEQRERKRIATELHDGVSQLLSSSFMRLDLLRQAPDLPPSAVESLDKIGAIIQQSLRQARSLTFELSCPMLNELGLAAALAELCRSMSHEWGIRIEFKGDERPLPLHFEQQVVLYRSVRELLVNVMKHSEACWACVRLALQEPDVRICVEDDGKGIDATAAGKGFSPTGGFGLFNIREYLQYAGGGLAIQSIPGGGTEVVLTMPLEGEDE